VVNGPVQLSSCRRRADGALEVRVWNPMAFEVEGGVAGGQKVDLRGNPLPDSPTLRTQEIATYRL
jgi:hypothetical protein